MTDAEIIQMIKAALELMPNLLFALVAIWYLARQNQRALEVMHQTNERQFELLSRLCQKCVEANHDHG